MRKIVAISAVAASLAVAAVALPSSAEARFGAGIDAAAIAADTGTLAQPVYYYYRRGYYRPRYYAPRYYAPRYYAPRYYAPRYYRYY
jgi:hypothetical protein